MLASNILRCSTAFQPTTNVGSCCCRNALEQRCAAAHSINICARDFYAHPLHLHSQDAEGPRGLWRGYSAALCGVGTFVVPRYAEIQLRYSRGAAEVQQRDSRDVDVAGVPSQRCRRTGGVLCGV